MILCNRLIFPTALIANYYDNPLTYFSWRNAKHFMILVSQNVLLTHYCMSNSIVIFLLKNISAFSIRGFYRVKLLLLPPLIRLCGLVLDLSPVHRRLYFTTLYDV